MEEMEEERGGGVELHRRDCTSSERDRKILIDPALPGHRGTVGSQQIFLAVYRGTEVQRCMHWYTLSAGGELGLAALVKPVPVR